MSKYQGAILLYGILMILLGIIGYFIDPTHNPGSIIGGGVVGILEIFFATYSKSNPRVGYIGAAIVALLTAGMFVPRSFQDPTWGFISIAVLSVALFLFLMGGHFFGRRFKNTNSDTNAVAGTKTGPG